MLNEWPGCVTPQKRNPVDGTVAIVMPVRGQSRFVRLAYYAIRYFTDVPFMFVFVNNQSDLKTKNLLVGYSIAHNVWVLENHDDFDKGKLVNIGLRHCFQYPGVKYGVTVDSDVIVGPEWLTRFVSSLNLDPKYGIVGPGMNVYPRKVYGRMTGSCMAFRRELFEELGGFKEGLPDGEDIDFCERAEANKWGVSHLGSIVDVHHFGGITRRAEENKLKSINTLSTSKEGRYEQRIKVG